MKILSRLSLAAILFLAPVLPAAAHEGHDHGAPEIAPAPTAVPTLEADGGDVQLVALLQSGNLTLYIDRLSDNSPVTRAEVTLSADGGKPVTATPSPDGTYRAAAPWATPGDHALNLTVTGDGVADLLVGTLTVPTPAATLVSSAGGVSLALAAGAFLAGLVLGAGLLAWRSRRAGLAVLLLAFLAVPATRVLAHEGHDHGTPAPEPVAGNSPKRLADGSLFVPKATQRLLSIRTTALAPGSVTPVAGLTGRVIADPNRSGRVQAPQSGRLMPPDGGFPLPGTRVKASDVLAYVELVLRAEDGSGINEQLAGLDKDIRLAQQQWNRLSNLKGAVAQAEIDDARATLDGLTRQREALSRAIAKRAPLTAPIDGVITTSNAVTGLMIEDRDVTLVFEITEPGAVLVEAIGFGEPPPVGAKVTASLHGNAIPLSLVGQGVGVAPGSTRLLLRPLPGAFGERVPALGTLLNLSLPAGAAVEGLLLPRDALVRGADGLPAVLVHEGAQRFVPRTVRVEPAGAGSVRLLAGVEAGSRIVVRGASLLAQIR
ncbi:efflux RND transporter periplasmic adaptor subunit [Niveispirillum sp. KHB5.9]|uniref:efflux RND transporter periplasmic adaptor subunit n=1 Tax=Niveispirillum sp. KHB5.9 TaxID=3400269 RepID=UPI003A894526